MDHKDNNHYHPPSNGFLMGVILGAVATLLFTTRKGREIVKDLADKGFEKYSDLEKALEKKTDEYEEIIEGDDYLEPVEVEKVKLAKEIKKDEDKIPTPPKPHRAVKRFFRKRS